jgi:hypothetical protein
MGVKLGLLHKGVNKLGVFEKRVLRRVSGHKREKVTRGQRKCIMKGFTICALRHNSILWSCVVEMNNVNPRNLIKERERRMAGHSHKDAQNVTETQHILMCSVKKDLHAHSPGMQHQIRYKITSFHLFFSVTWFI